MGLFQKFRAGLQKTHSQLAHEIKRIVTRSPKLDAAGLEELEALLAEYPKGDAAPRMLLLLGEGYRERRKFAEAEKVLGRVVAEFGDSPEATRAATVLEQMKTDSRKTDAR